jgi:hypothetical protein
MQVAKQRRFIGDEIEGEKGTPDNQATKPQPSLLG